MSRCIKCSRNATQGEYCYQHAAIEAKKRGIACPHCGQQIDTDDVAFHNADQYNQLARMRTPCCSKLITVTPVRSYRLDVYEGPEQLDNWER